MNSSATAWWAVVVVVSLCAGTILLTGTGASATLDDLEGSGTAEDPFVITTAAELQRMQQDRAAHYVLGNDIDASSTTDFDDGSGFDPVGSEDAPFSGTFDGRGHTITNLTVDRPISGQVGLFGRIEDGRVRDVRLERVAIEGGTEVGAVAGETAGRSVVTNVTVTGTVRGAGEEVGGVVGDFEGSGALSNVIVAADVTGGDAVGGVVGEHNDAGLTGSSATVTVSGGDDIGGIVGEQNGGTVSTFRVTATVDGDADVGGVTGENLDGTVSTGTVRGTVTGTLDVGGAVAEQNNGAITDVAASTNVTGGTNVGGLVGRAAGPTISNAYAAGNVAGEDVLGGLVGKVDAGTVEQSFATGTVQDAPTVGGLIGTNQGAVTDAYWDTEATGQSTSDGGAGLTTAEMTGATARNTLDGLAFGSTWVATDEYPVLASEGESLSLTVSRTTIGTGDVLQPEPRLTLTDGTTVSVTETATLERSNTNVLQIRADGTVEAISGGQAILSASLASFQDATDVTVIETAAFGVRIESTTAPVTAGDTLTVEATVTNDDAIGDTQTVVLRTVGAERDSTSITLASGESQPVSLDWPTAVGDAGSYEAVVTTPSTTDTVSVTVEAASTRGDSDTNEGSSADQPSVGGGDGPANDGNGSDANSTNDSTGNATNEAPLSDGDDTDDAESAADNQPANSDTDRETTTSPDADTDSDEGVIDRLGGIAAATGQSLLDPLSEPLPAAIVATVLAIATMCLHLVWLSRAGTAFAAAMYALSIRIAMPLVTNILELIWGAPAPVGPVNTVLELAGALLFLRFAVTYTGQEWPLTNRATWGLGGLGVIAALIGIAAQSGVQGGSASLAAVLVWVPTTLTATLLLVGLGLLVRTNAIPVLRTIWID
jgi:hypothetical protein